MIQRFLQPGITSWLVIEHPAELVYMCKAEGSQSAMPRAMHRHDDRTEVVFIREGQGTHIIGGREYRTHKGDVLIYNRGILHDETSPAEEGISVYCCGFQNLKLKGLPVNCLVPDQGSPVLPSGEHYTAFDNLMQLLYTQIDAVHGGSNQVCDHLLQALIQMVGGLLERPKPRLDMPGYNLGHEVQRYIDEHYAEELDLQVIAKRFKVSHYHLAHRFTATIGCAPIHYLIRRRVGEAQSLLINTNLSVADVAERVGYRHPSYFNTAFKRVVGVTPGDYRRRYLVG